MTAPIDRVLALLPGAKKTGNGWDALCPAHDDHKPSLGISVGDDGCALLHCRTGCATEAVVSKLGLTMVDLMPDRNGSARRNGSAGKPSRPPQVFATAKEAISALERSHGTHSATWAYQDSSGEPCGVIARWDGPNGKTVRPVSRVDNGWSMSAMPGPRPLYRLDTLASSEQVYICEGEKAADAARATGFVATTCAGGSNATAKTDWTPLAGKSVVILPDNDPAGRKYADTVASILMKLSPRATVRIVELPYLSKGDDIVEFVDACGSHAAARTEVDRLVDAAEPIQPHKPRAPVILRMADVFPEPIQWLWPGKIALGKMSMIVGDPGLGKSFLTLDMAARVSTGTPWPDDRETPNAAGGVILLSAEDDPGDTIRPRLDAAHADVSRIVVLQAVRQQVTASENPTDRLFSLGGDIRVLEDAIQQVSGTRLVIIDPITAYLGGVDSHKNGEMRGLLAPLADLAGRAGVAIVCVSHLNKAAGMAAIYRTMGSLAFAAAARSVWAVVKDPKDPKQRRRLFGSVKNNLAQNSTCLAFTVDSVDRSEQYGPAFVSWSPEPVATTIDEALAPPSRESPKMDEARAWLEERLASGPKEKRVLVDDAKADGISPKTLLRAFEDMGGKSSPGGFGKSWLWGLPSVAHTVSTHAPMVNTGELAQKCSIDHRDTSIEPMVNTGAGTADDQDDPDVWGTI